MNHKVSTSFILDTRRSKAGDLYPVKLRLIYNRQNRLYSTVFDLSKEDYKKVMGKPRDEYKKIRKKLENLENSAIEIIEGMKWFSFNEFSEKFYGKTSIPTDTFSFYENYLAKLEKEDRIGSANTYLCSLNSLKKFYPRAVLDFTDITVAFLKRYEAWFLMQGNSLTTVGIYLRCLRSIFNQAIMAKIVSRDDYPFGRGQYEIPSPENVKKALSSSDLETIFNYKSTNEILMYYKDLWIFSYLCNGANIKDICLLKYKDISGFTIIFRRAKTSTTNRKAKPITAAYTSHLKKIIDSWGNKPVVQENFIFPVLAIGDSEKVIKKKVALLVVLINKYIGIVASDLNIRVRITTYTARHSFATKLKRSGVSTAFISEFLGHASQKTTESYLGSIETHDLLKIAETLTTF